MAKRFTDTTKWNRADFQSLSPIMKLVWIYLCDACDNAGVWEINISLLNFQTGAATTLNEILESFSGKVEVVNDKLLIKAFIEFQYGVPFEELNENSKPHKSVISRINSVRLSSENKGYTKGIHTFQDKDKDKDKDKKGESEGENSLAACLDAWRETLEAFGYERDPRLDDYAIVEAAKRYGYDRVRLALVGARNEPSTETYDPKKYLSIKRVLSPKNFDRFEILGSKAKPKRENVEWT